MQTTQTGRETRACRCDHTGKSCLMTAAQGKKVEEGGMDGVGVWCQALDWGAEEPRMAAFLFPPLLHSGPSALLVLLAVLGVACEDKIVIVELSQLAVETLVSLKFLGRRKDAATLWALQEAEKRIQLNQIKLKLFFLNHKKTKQKNPKNIYIPDWQKAWSQTFLAWTPPPPSWPDHHTMSGRGWFRSWHRRTQALGWCGWSSKFPGENKQSCFAHCSLCYVAFVLCDEVATQTYISLHSIHWVATRVEHCGVDHRTWYQVTNSTHLRGRRAMSTENLKPPPKLGS